MKCRPKFTRATNGFCGDRVASTSRTRPRVGIGHDQAVAGVQLHPLIYAERRDVVHEVALRVVQATPCARASVNTWPDISSIASRSIVTST